VPRDRRGPGSTGPARTMGVPFEGLSGHYNAITDVAGVEVGQVTLVSGHGRLQVGRGPVRTGVTIILPAGRTSREVLAGAFVFNGSGEFSGLEWIKETGLLGGPIVTTTSFSLGLVRDAVVAWARDNLSLETPCWLMPAVGETLDAPLNDCLGQHIRREHVWQAIKSSTGGPVAQGNVGGGTGMQAYGFKSGIGTASRILSTEAGGYTVGILVQDNHGSVEDLIIGGIPMGQELKHHAFTQPRFEGFSPVIKSSLLMIIGTDAPLSPGQLSSLARRAILGAARTGAIGERMSGDVCLAFSMGNIGVDQTTVGFRPPATGLLSLGTVPNQNLDLLFRATVQAAEEAIVNGLVAAETMTRAGGITIPAIPHNHVRRILADHNRLVEN
jgi:D-aminopeptidase